MRMISKLSLLFICLLLAKCASAYRNPLVLPKEAEGPGIADPGLLRWMGKYYLYSTKTGEQGIRCWESADLVNWQFKAYCTDDDPVFASRMAWSPAPFYFNGKFYLYICGIDQKHKVFESENPWGPFRCVNADFLDVNTLDAVPFLDDDGKLYLFYAGWSRTGIQWRTCSSPINADGKNQKLIACQFSVNPNNWWTEGPAVFKRNGIYYLTYCGNNWQEDNYQIRAAKGYTIASLRPQNDSPLIAQLSGPWVATGCNWMILGPDMKSLWNIYHCRKHGSWERRLCLDRLYIDPNTKNLWTEGPTWDERPNPELPTWQEDWRTGNLSASWKLSKGKYTIKLGEGIISDTQGFAISFVRQTGNSFVAEFNIRLIKMAEGASYYGILLCESGQGGILVKIDPKAHKLTIASSVGKEIPTRTTFIPKWLDLSTWHTLRIEKQEDRIQVYLNDMRKFNIRANLGGGRFELVADACAVQFGWCGFSDYKGPDDGIEKAQSTNK